MKLEKSMVYFNTSIRGNEVMLSKLQSIFQEPMYMDAELLEDVETELKQATPHGEHLQRLSLPERWMLLPPSSPTT